jgi:hypothetical protein
MLMTALRVFEHLHDLVFAHMRAAPPAATPDAAAGWDIRNVMAAEKRQVLSGEGVVGARLWLCMLVAVPVRKRGLQESGVQAMVCGNNCV